MTRAGRGALAVALLLRAMADPAGADAQPGPPPPPVVSPEVHADRRVTLRLLAPRADTVLLAGEILDGGRPLPLARDTSGRWSITVGPLAPDIYTYLFVIDGVATPDPVNGYVKTGPGGVFATASQVEVPGDGPQYYDARPVPHGLVSLLQYDSKSLGVPRRAMVYTPPGYETSRGAYPVVVLMHGSGETEVDWVLAGRANQVADNLIADGRARPMVIVMPLGHARQSGGIGPVPNAPSAHPPMDKRFAYDEIQRDLLSDLMPEVERRFRVSRDPDERAIVGLSLGGSQATRIGLNNLDAFRWIVPLSAAYLEQDPATGFDALLANVPAANRKLKLLRIMIGERDFLLEGNRKFSAMLAQAGVRHELVIEPGRHEWRVWRRNLRDVLPLLFRR